MAARTRTYNDAMTRRRPREVGSGDAEVGDLKRRRIVTAAVDVVDEVGCTGMTVARVIARAHVSRKTFYDVFSDREECFRAAFEQSVERARALATEAYAREHGWREGIRGALGQLLLFMEEEPAAAKLCVVEALSAGDGVLERRAELLEELNTAVDRGRLLTSKALQPHQVTAEGIVGAIVAVLHKRLIDGGPEPLSDLLRPLMSMVVLPYLGAREARRELNRPPLQVVAIALPPPARRRDPLAGLDIRLTYRTVRVLMAIAAHPGASNREIAEAAGIVDQGQISKLLTRLERLKLIRNSGGGQELGTANAWSLTQRGAELERATRLR
jgi:AcrR family transcriptional regulator